MTLTGTKAQTLVNGMTNMLMNDTRVTSKVDDVFVLVGGMQQKTLPVVGGILVNTTTYE